MTTFENYKRAVVWMRRNLTELAKMPEHKLIQDAVLQSFEVTFNISEEILRRAYVSSGEDEAAAYLSVRELIYRANASFPCNMHWLEYGLALESAHKQYLETADVNLGQEMQVLLVRYTEELERFALSLERKMVAGV